MARKTFSVRLPDEVRDRLESHASETGSSMSDIVTEALSKYFALENPETLSERVARLEREFAVLRSATLHNPPGVP